MVGRVRVCECVFVPFLEQMLTMIIMSSCSYPAFALTLSAGHPIPGHDWLCVAGQSKISFARSDILKFKLRVEFFMHFHK